MMSVGMLLFGACSQRSMPDEAESGMLSRQEGDAQEDADVQESGDAREKAQNPGQQENRILTEGEREESEEAKTGGTDFSAELLRFRQDREDMIRTDGEYIEMGTPNEAEYEIDFSAISEQPQFEYQEMAAAYEAARLYVTKSLGICPPTKCEVYMCMDPKMAEIYRDEDKGVAAGYGNDNIFLSEFCDENHNWQCIVLVREGKGQPWNVIYCGNDYKE